MPFSGVARWLACLPIIGWCLQRHRSSRRDSSTQGSDHAPADDQQPAARLSAADRVDSAARHTEHAVLASSSSHAAPAAVPLAGVDVLAGSHQALSADLDSCSPDEQDSSSPCSAVDVQVVPLDAVQAAGSSPAKQLPQPGPGSGLANHNESSQDSSSPAPVPACGTTLAAGALLSTSPAPCSPSKHTSPACLSFSSSSPPQQDSSTADASHAPPAPVHLAPAAAAAQSVAAAEGSEFTTAAAQAAPAAASDPNATKPPRFSLPKWVDKYHPWIQQQADLLASGVLRTPSLLLRHAVYPTLALKPVLDSAAKLRPAQGSEKARLKPEQQLTCTVELWGYRVLWAGMWRAVQAADGPKGRLELNEDTAEALLLFTWHTFRPAGPNEVRPAGSEEAPDWGLERDVAEGMGRDGKPMPFFLPTYITGPEDLKEKVLGGENAAAWLLRRYKELAEDKMRSRQDQKGALGSVYSFLKVDPVGPTLVVDTEELQHRVLRWARTAEELLKKQAQDKEKQQGAAAAVADGAPSAEGQKVHRNKRAKQRKKLKAAAAAHAGALGGEVHGGA